MHPRKQQDRARETQERILRAALLEFSAHGLAGARIARIAAQARANKERIYAYFGSKNKLFSAVLQQGFSDIARAEEDLLRLLDDDVPRLDRRILEYYLAFHERHPHFWRLLAWENLTGGRHAGALRGLRAAPFQHLQELYARGQAQGIFPKETSFEAFLFLMSAVTYFSFSNELTMSHTLGLDLSKRNVRLRLGREILAWLGRGRKTGRTRAKSTGKRGG